MPKFIIPQGWHYSLPFYPRIHFGLKNNSFLSFDVVIENGLYEPDTNNHTNKIFGLSFGYHLNNSIRVGWNIKEGRMKLMLYLHVNKEIRYYDLLPFDEGQKLNVTIYRYSNALWIKVTTNGYSTLKMITDFDDTKTLDKWGYFLKPYFGGKPTAPDNIKILIDKITFYKKSSIY